MLNTFKLEKLLPDMKLVVSDAKTNFYTKNGWKGAKAKSVTKTEVKEISMPKKREYWYKNERPFLHHYRRPWRKQ